MPVQPPHRVELARLPTPLTPLLRRSAELGNAKLWIKRDDLTGLELSGNKIRKLEYILGEAIESGCDTIVTEGAPQSNHCRATAAAAARLGLHAHLLLLGEPADEQPQGNLLLDTLFGATVHCDEQPASETAHNEIVERQLTQLRADGYSPRFTPLGASEPVGCWGYIRAAAELAVQIDAAGIDTCDIVVALSSGGTLGGLVLGKLLHRVEQYEVWGVPVSDDVATLRQRVADLCRKTIQLFNLPINFDESCLNLIDGYIGPGYAMPYEAAIKQLRAMAVAEGIVLDPVYTAKAMCAVADGIRDGRFGRDRPVVFLHSGGLFSNFAWPATVLGKVRPGEG